MASGDRGGSEYINFDSVKDIFTWFTNDSRNDRSSASSFRVTVSLSKDNRTAPVQPSSV